MIPGALLKAAKDCNILVELKSAVTFNGKLVASDSFMNIKLAGGVIRTSRDGERFWQMEEVYIKGTSIKYISLPEPLLEQVAEQEEEEAAHAQQSRGGGRGRGRGGGGGRGRGRGGGGGGRR